MIDTFGDNFNLPLKRFVNPAQVNYVDNYKNFIFYLNASFIDDSSALMMLLAVYAQLTSVFITLASNYHFLFPRITLIEALIYYLTDKVKTITKRIEVVTLQALLNLVCRHLLYRLVVVEPV